MRIKIEFERNQALVKLNIEEPIKDVTFNQLANEYLEEQKLLGRSPKYIQMLEFYLNNWKNRLGSNSLLSNIKQRDIESNIKQRLRKVKRSTVNHEITMLKALFSLAVSSNYLKVSPMEGIKRLPDDTQMRDRPAVYKELKN